MPFTAGALSSGIGASTETGTGSDFSATSGVDDSTLLGTSTLSITLASSVS